MSISRQPFGRTRDGQDVELFVLQSRNLLAKIITYGGRVTELHAPDKSGRMGNVVLGFDRLEPYLTDKAYLGTLVGRVANRIGGARFSLDGVEYQLPPNEGKNILHGGAEGLDKAIWQAEPREDAGSQSLVLRCKSPDGESGFPGNLDATVAYTVRDNALHIDYTATTDRATPVNLTNHAYFNLRGPGSDDVLSHALTIAASKYTPVNDQLIPTGEITAVSGTPMDFTRGTPIGQRIKQVGIGYDHNYVLDTNGDAAKLAARVEDPASGRAMEVLTTEPAVQLYTGNFLNGSISGLGGSYGQYGAFCLEAQRFPDAVNHANFPDTILRPGATYRQTTIYRFTH